MASGKAVIRARPWAVVCFLFPALLLLGALVVYPIGYSVQRSLFDASGDSFVGLDNFKEIFSDDGIRTALENTLIWIVVAPTVATALGLVFAVLTERIRWATVFKLIVFMPMAVSMLASGIIFRMVYEQDPDRGLANALATTVHDTFASSSSWPDAEPRPGGSLTVQDDGSYLLEETVSAGSPVLLPLVAVPQPKLSGAELAQEASSDPGQVTGTIWMDFTRGGEGVEGAIDPEERALSGIKVEALRDGEVVADTKTGDDGTFQLPAEADGAQLRLAADNFTAPYNGVEWLGPKVITPAIIASYVWMWAGFAMVLIAAGLASVPRETLEAARVDGANEWQVFRRITVPLLAPVLGVVAVTLMINVLKIFDLVYVIAPASSQADANVLALELYLSSFGAGANQGVGSAIAVFLLLLVVPVMIINLRRLRRENQR
ncbi:carbohydrate ABC transporter permease [Streptomyces profundus]|uniref:carbohydrate ABC transporter permease n=1 Tax=Streptomyces profundus TaxID=2867410 RepID=UPI001D164F98|nr:sugar ABC transporter permease [Streptomyces sp. MA3_2.13]UED86036.1 sugar ABC transporter permease [Streptomyces sp. MA3_2.13]